MSHVPRARILVVDDENQIRKLLRISLATQGYQIVEAANGAEGIAAAANYTPDLVILDLGLPDMDGQDVLQELRSWSNAPVLMLSVRSGEDTKVAALDLGANDFVTKPFGIQELLARVRVLLRASHANRGADPTIERGPLRIQLAKRQVRLAGEEINLTRKEYGVLALLAQHQGRIVTQQQLLRSVWGASHAHDNHYLRIVVGRLRQKLGDPPTEPTFIKTEAGVGYRLLDAEP
ncbi:response regulator [Pseudomonas matsuisoli]|uniref:DNA-binding response regulator n=1 Tax=Pseudomonas matsuisoli TaxID=1515666 RepID=A0A917UUV2_9PSED|nr:response regulator transcription factor [Pseudomonas matsuisoli]GGJ87849.1 DNA-binding response regulator [Pseudomonas matsuisoli]